MGFIEHSTQHGQVIVDGFVLQAFSALHSLEVVELLFANLIEPQVSQSRQQMPVENRPFALSSAQLPVP